MNVLTNQPDKYTSVYERIKTDKNTNKILRLLIEASIKQKIMQNAVDGMQVRYVNGIRVHYHGDDENGYISCPVCQHTVTNRRKRKETWPKHCQKCGTRLIY